MDFDNGPVLLIAFGCDLKARSIKFSIQGFVRLGCV
jgi:hypothetical protein